jgi:small-conductance mechanosensitive channel
MQSEAAQQLAKGADRVRKGVGDLPWMDRRIAEIGGKDVTIASLIVFVVILLLAYLVSKLLQRALQRFYQRRGLDEGVQYALNRLLHYTVMAFGVFLALENVNISVSALAGLGAIFAVGIGFGLQNIAQNFVSGLILLLERPVKKGDFVEVGDARGTVREIHARATVVTTVDNVDILVPNGQFITEPVVNQTFQNRRIRVHVEVGAAYGSDTDLVKTTLERVAAEHDQVLTDPPPKVWFTNFGDSSLDFSLLFWIPDPILRPQISSDLRFAIDRAFRAAKIEMPFPQRDLHVIGKVGIGDEG